MLIYVNSIAATNAVILRLYNKVSTKGGITEFTSTVSRFFHPLFDMYYLFCRCTRDDKLVFV